MAAPHQGHLDTIIEEIKFQLDTNADLLNSIDLTKHGKPKIHRKPYFRLEFTIGWVLCFRPAGAYGDAFHSLHVERVWVDEGAWLTERAWKALRQCLESGGPAAHLLHAQRPAGHYLILSPSISMTA